MQMVRARQPPELLPGDVAHAEGGVAVVQAPAVSVAVDREPGELAKGRESGKANRVEARHEAGALVRDNDIVMTLHGIQLVGGVDGVHDFLAGFLGMRVYYRHDSFDSLGEWAVRRVRHEFVVFDEVDSGVAELVNQLCRGARGQADAGLDDRAYNRSLKNSGKRSGSRDTERRARIALDKLFGKRHIEQFQPRMVRKLEQVTEKRCDQCRKINPDVLQRPGECHYGLIVRRAGFTTGK